MDGKNRKYIVIYGNPYGDITITTLPNRASAMTFIKNTYRNLIESLNYDMQELRKRLRVISAVDSRIMDMAVERPVEFLVSLE